MCREDLDEGCRQMLDAREPIRHLDGRGRAVTSALGIGTRPIARDDLHPGVLPQPLRHRFGGPLRQQGHGLPAFQIHQDRAIGVPFAQGKIVHPEHPGRGHGGQRQLPEQAQEGVPAHGQVPLVAQLHPGGAPQGHAEGA
jgi:hypothetical protein